MRTYVATPKTIESRLHVIDADGQVLGRIATLAASVAMRPRTCPSASMTCQRLSIVFGVATYVRMKRGSLSDVPGLLCGKRAQR